MKTRSRIPKFNLLKLIKKNGKILYGLIFVVLVLIAGVVAISALEIPGNYKLLVVQSGSMEPAIKKGAVVVTKPQSDYQKGDVITVVEPANPRVSLTHRIVDIEEKDGKIFYTTKGDANENADTEKRPRENVIGKLLFSVPYVGHVIAFAKTKEGLILLVVIPATVIVYSELLSIKKEIQKILMARRQKKRKMGRGFKKRLSAIMAKIALACLVFNFPFMPLTNSYLLDTEQSTANSFTVGSVDLSLRDAGGVPLTSSLFNISDMKPGDSQSKMVKVYKDGTLDFQYSLKANKTGGDDTLCNTLQIEAKLDTVSQYNGSLTGLNLNPATIISGGVDDWEFIIRFNSSASSLQGKSCSFDLIVKGWQVGSDGTWGLTDEEVISGNQVATGWWVEPNVEVTSPNGGEFWTGGSTQNITWTASSSDPLATVTLDLYYSTDSGATYPNVIATGEANDGVYSWTLPGVKSDKMRVKVVATDSHGLVGEDTSDSDFDPVDPVSESSPILEFFLREDKQAVGFKVKNVATYESLRYEIVYDTSNGDRGIISTVKINGQNVIERSNLVLGTCSGIEGKVCVYDQGVNEIDIKIVLLDSDGKEKLLEDEIHL